MMWKHLYAPSVWSMELWLGHLLRMVWLGVSFTSNEFGAWVFGQTRMASGEGSLFHSLEAKYRSIPEIFQVVMLPRCGPWADEVVWAHPWSDFFCITRSGGLPVVWSRSSVAVLFYSFDVFLIRNVVCPRKVGQRRYVRALSVNQYEKANCAR